MQDTRRRYDACLRAFDSPFGRTVIEIRRIWPVDRGGEVDLSGFCGGCCFSFGTCGCTTALDGLRILGFERKNCVDCLGS